jgi:hypothetical protein
MAVVELAATMRPSAHMEDQLRVEKPGPDGEPTLARPEGFMMMARIAGMSLDERLEILKSAAMDDMVILFALYPYQVRRVIFDAATKELKQQVQR